MRSKYIFIVLLFTMVSCKKFLQEKSDKRLVVPESISDLQGLLDDGTRMNMQTPSFGEVSSDDYFLLPINYDAATEQDKNSYKWSLQNYKYPNDWAACYTPIYNSNYCLEQIEKVERTTENANSWNNVKGSALFFRGFYFMELAWEYSLAYDSATAPIDKGIVLRLQSNFNVPSKRANVQDTYNQIISDLKTSSESLPNIPIHPMRPSKAAAFSALARAYLSMRSYDSALKYSNLALQLKSDLIDYNNTSVVNKTNNVPFKPFNNEIIFYAVESFNFNLKSPVFAKIDTALYASYNSNDLRKTVFFRNASGYQRFKGSYAADQIRVFSGIAVDEVLLIRAECLARKGNLTESMNDLNNLLQKRWLTGKFYAINASTQSDALNIILSERRKELLMRGLRWIDIKRLNKEGFNIELQRSINNTIIKLPPNDKRYALKLPMDIIEISGIEQNN